MTNELQQLPKLRRRVHRRAAIGLVLACLAFAPMLRAEEAKDAKSVVLTVTNERGEKTELTLEKLRSLPRKSIKATDHSGNRAEYQGVPISEVLKLAKVTLGEKLRGPLLANYVLVEALDGYRTVFALPELDDTNTDKIVLLADMKNGEPLPKTHAPLQFIIPDEHRFARWIRQVKSISIQQAPGKPAPAAK